MLLLRVIRGFLILAWPATVFAAQNLGEAFGSIGWATGLILFLLSTMSGLTALFWRLADMFKSPDRPVPQYLHLVIVAQMLSSWLAGVLAFLLAMHFEVSPWWLGASIVAASFAGSRAIDMLSARIYPQLQQDQSKQ